MMKKVFIDTSVFIRFLTQDDREKFEECESFFKEIELGKLRPYASNIVILEIIFVLARIYKFPLKTILTRLKVLLQLRNLNLIEKTNTPQALKLLGRFDVKYGDCLIATQLPVRALLVTYDEDFKKMGLRNLTEPKGLIG